MCFFLVIYEFIHMSMLSIDGFTCTLGYSSIHAQPKFRSPFNSFEHYIHQEQWMLHRLSLALSLYSV